MAYQLVSEAEALDMFVKKIERDQCEDIKGDTISMIDSLKSIPAPLWLLASALFFGCGEYLSKKWGMHPSISMTVIVVSAYAVSVLLWLPVMLQKNSLAVMGTAWLLLAILATLGLGIFVFHESLSMYQWIGVVLATGALVLLNM